MLPHRIVSGILTTCLIALAILPAAVAAQDVCLLPAQSSYERAFIQAHGERFVDSACADGCATDAADALAAYQRAFIQAHGERFAEPACGDDCATVAVDTMATYERALIQAQDHVMVGVTSAQCGVRLA